MLFNITIYVILILIIIGEIMEFDKLNDEEKKQFEKGKEYKEKYLKTHNNQRIKFLKLSAKSEKDSENNFDLIAKINYVQKSLYEPGAIFNHKKYFDEEQFISSINNSLSKLYLNMLHYIEYYYFYFSYFNFRYKNIIKKYSNINKIVRNFFIEIRNSSKLNLYSKNKYIRQLEKLKRKEKMLYIMNYLNYYFYELESKKYGDFIDMMGYPPEVPALQDGTDTISFLSNYISKKRIYKKINKLFPITIVEIWPGYHKCLFDLDSFNNLYWYALKTNKLISHFFPIPHQLIYVPGVRYD
jgi:hypothetical protein